MTLFTAAYCLSLGFVLGLSVMLQIARNAWLLSTNRRVTRLEAQIGKFQEESLYYMSQNAKMQAVVDAAKAIGWHPEEDMYHALVALGGEE
jgi:hypothetical protein